jgi:hypothetical protein
MAVHAVIRCARIDVHERSSLCRRSSLDWGPHLRGGQDLFAWALGMLGCFLMRDSDLLVAYVLFLFVISDDFLLHRAQYYCSDSLIYFRELSH